MKDKVEAYRLAEKEQQTRLDSFQADADVCSLVRELALSRMMTEEAHERGNLMLARDLLSVTASLSKAHQLALEKRGMLLNRADLRLVMDALIRIIRHRLQEALPDTWEDVNDQIADDFLQAVITRPQKLQAPDQQ